MRSINLGGFGREANENIDESTLEIPKKKKKLLFGNNS